MKNPRRYDRGHSLACNVGIPQIVPRKRPPPVGQSAPVFFLDHLCKRCHDRLVCCLDTSCTKWNEGANTPSDFPYRGFFQRNVLYVLQTYYFMGYLEGCKHYCLFSIVRLVRLLRHI